MILKLSDGRRLYQNQLWARRNSIILSDMKKKTTMSANQNKQQHNVDILLIICGLQYKQKKLICIVISWTNVMFLDSELDISLYFG